LVDVGPVHIDTAAMAMNLASHAPQGLGELRLSAWRRVQPDNKLHLVAVWKRGVRTVAPAIHEAAAAVDRLRSDFATCDTLHDFLHNPRLWRLTCGSIGDSFDAVW
jgi:hypothetical protein